MSQALIAALQNRADQPVIHAMRYAVQGGKRLRGFLVLESARLHDIAPQNALSAAAAPSTAEHSSNPEIPGFAGPRKCSTRTSMLRP